MSKWLLGIDVGGTKCAVILGQAEGENVRIVERTAFCTPDGPEATLAQIEITACELLAGKASKPEGIGISCGGPLDSRRGIVLGPPNLPGWEHVAICERFTRAFGVPACLQNDANACAVAEWKWGAGRGSANMVFLTFGTGMGAGLILNGRLYSGTNDLAGEIGHVRLADDGPVGYGKRGSVESFCSGAGILKLAHENGLTVTSTQQVFEAAAKADPTAIEVIRTSAEYLGRGLALIVDILNPELIIIGGIFARQQNQLWPIAEAVMKAEALPGAVGNCRVIAAALGEQIGDYAALSVATLGI